MHLILIDTEDQEVHGRMFHCRLVSLLFHSGCTNLEWIHPRCNSGSPVQQPHLMGELEWTHPIQCGLGEDATTLLHLQLFFPMQAMLKNGCLKMSKSFSFFMGIFIFITSLNFKGIIYRYVNLKRISLVPSTLKHIEY